ncbi:hypothetical protein [Neisseria sp. Ec49-e6-T10]|uniref:hypothetical protein n=1 Tax=Neisseria sp. Ec49-e6-T10 TaxID=3140744 RepID=UPI003EB6DFB6
MKTLSICGLMSLFLCLAALCSGGALDDFLKEPWTPSGQVIVKDQDLIDQYTYCTNQAVLADSESKSYCSNY